MTTNEVRKIIADSEHSDWYESINLHITYPHLDFDQTLTGFSSIHKFLEQQINGWDKFGENIPSELKVSKKHFSTFKSRLENHLNSFINSNHNESQLNNSWNSEKNQIQNNKTLFVFDSPQTEFLIKIHREIPKYYAGAYNFVMGNYNISNKESMIGHLLAYEFELKDYTEITKRRDKEKSSIGRLRNDFRSQLSESETQLAEHLKSANVEFKNYTQKIDELKTEKETHFEDWFGNSKKEFTDFDTASKEKIADLEHTYEELLRLKKPAEYWNQRATKLNKEGWKAIYWLVGLVAFACITLYFLLWLTPDGMLLSFIKGQASAIKWSIIYVTFISFLAFGIRALNKVAFSAFHLSRDAEEREQLTYVYLSLIKDSAVDEKDKSLIMQSLFSRAETGLLKGDSGPAMPNDITGKIFGGN
ncbi:DUF6161 domain-containing protein [Polaribacter sp. HaHaR_3_91]|uniref:DUF6161 domain-containing protein n=1 Tax=Polaribacter sp. HaHaR_3_91 TaxID=2745561 RepID=UPI001C4FA457|nr:DUF6161 domain-containing protein [Polaribacter sp. HaHaR_3_91]QXP62256.1 hypothetical protein H0I27_10185 [Polaribacter sp. HaHaR_3_91]